MEYFSNPSNHFFGPFTLIAMSFRDQNGSNHTRVFTNSCAPFSPWLCFLLSPVSYKATPLKMAPTTYLKYQNSLLCVHHHSVVGRSDIGTNRIIQGPPHTQPSDAFRDVSCCFVENDPDGIFSKLCKFSLFCPSSFPCCEVIIDEIIQALHPSAPLSPLSMLFYCPRFRKNGPNCKLETPNYPVFGPSPLLWCEIGTGQVTYTGVFTHASVNRYPPEIIATVPGIIEDGPGGATQYLQCSPFFGLSPPIYCEITD